MPAWVDESVNVRLGLYLLSAYICSSDEEALSREILADSAIGRRRRFHWRSEGPILRRRAIEVLGSLPGGFAIVIGNGLVNSRQERARQLCLRQLLLHLDLSHVNDIVLERRDRHLNARDIRTAEGLRGAGWIRSSTHITHGDPHADSLLWIADVLCGMWTQNLTAGVAVPAGLESMQIIRINVT